MSKAHHDSEDICLSESKLRQEVTGNEAEL